MWACSSASLRRQSGPRCVPLLDRRKEIRRAGGAPLLLTRDQTLLLLGRRGRLLQALARLLGLLLQLFLQLLRVLFELLRIRRRAVVRLGEVGERQRVARGLSGQVD